MMDDGEGAREGDGGRAAGYESLNICKNWNSVPAYYQTDVPTGVHRQLMRDATKLAHAATPSCNRNSRIPRNCFAGGKLQKSVLSICFEHGSIFRKVFDPVGPHAGPSMVTPESLAESCFGFCPNPTQQSDKEPYPCCKSSQNVAELRLITCDPQ